MGIPVPPRHPPPAGVGGLLRGSQVRVRVGGAGWDVAVDVPDLPGGERRVDGRAVEADVLLVAPGLYSVLFDRRSYEVTVDPAGGPEVQVTVGGRPRLLQVEDERLRAVRAVVAGPAGGPGGGGFTVVAPMPGRVVAVPVAVGDGVERGQTVVVLEAMKMESALSTAHAGRVAEVLVSPGQVVQQRQALVRIDG